MNEDAVHTFTLTAAQYAMLMFALGAAVAALKGKNESLSWEIASLVKTVAGGQPWPVEPEKQGSTTE